MIILIIQVNWIVNTAKIKEDIFNEKANIVLSKTAEALSSDTTTCKQMEACIGKDEIHKTDSLFTNYMKFYDFHIDYSFAVKQPGTTTEKNDGALANNVYKKRLEEEATKNGLELNLFLPGKNKFIVAEMGGMFITSVILIIVVLFLFWRTVLSLMKEKEISEHTTDFLNNMTHEFKTPLTNIALAGKMMIRNSEVNHDEKIRHYSEIILHENEKLRLQVEQVLSMTALERGEIPLNKTEVDFHELIKDSLKCISVQIENKHGDVQQELKADNFIVSGDKAHLTNAFSNLIDNAIKYSKDKPELKISTANRDGKLIVAVADRGIGIERKYLDKVFEKYFRIPTGDLHNVKGFGLGLAYIKKIVELHGGNITLQSEKGRGTTFTIILPYVKTTT